LGGRKGIRPVKKYGGWWRWSGTGCLPLLISPCTIKSRSSLLAPADPGGPGKRAVKRLWCDGGIHVVFLIRLRPEKVVDRLGRVFT